MFQEKVSRASDNFSPADPDIMRAFIKATEGATPSYGSDEWTAKSEKFICHICKAKPKILFAPSGTAGNVLALKISWRSYESVLFHSSLFLEPLNPRKNSVLSLEYRKK